MHNIYTAKVDDSTLNDVIREGENRGRRRASRALLCLITLLVFGALAQLYEREGTVRAVDAHGSITVTHATVAQGGDDIKLEVLVSSATELPATATVSVSRRYLQLFEDFALLPEPDAQTSDRAGTVEFEFATQPHSKAMRVLFTGRTADHWEPRTDGTVQASWDGAGPYTTELSTWRIP